MLNLNPELLEISLLPRNIIATAGHEGAVADAHHVRRLGIAISQEIERGKGESENGTDFHCGILQGQRLSCATHGAILRSTHCCSFMIAAPVTASITRVAKPFPSGSVLHEFSPICYLEITAVQYNLFLSAEECLAPKRTLLHAALTYRDL